MHVVKGNQNVAIGYKAGQYAASSNNVFIGSSAIAGTSSGFYNYTPPKPDIKHRKIPNNMLELPDGHELCPLCLGWNKIVVFYSSYNYYGDSSAASKNEIIKIRQMHICWFCGGVGYVDWIKALTGDIYDGWYSTSGTSGGVCGTTSGTSCYTKTKTSTPRDPVRSVQRTGYIRKIFSRIRLYLMFGVWKTGLDSANCKI
jgi:hypothetical protein